MGLSATAVIFAPAATGLTPPERDDSSHVLLPAEACSYHCQRSDSVNMKWTRILCSQALPASDFRNLFNWTRLT
ncbi:uncharacterized protein SCHCODRAFT_02025949 [Schizophyllum commune H4-8]|uniref:uncharacterized protein n=1 Tax=Schizophyllum commune (strain H4-8 / FGSC 9210) TaxID=578458 RepID=UPI00215E42A8|nr:uncharacterized protein SCHCODRAFT_02025949 [Schizophyllum commune H4-8]KAI5899996.1 hypothetical protein SCHCODRAFT_02025949 [Schizophyllum commune H4-8]